MSELARLHTPVIEAAIQSAALPSESFRAAEVHVRLGSWLVRFLAFDFIFGSLNMFDLSIAGALVILPVLVAYQWRRLHSKKRELERHSISAENLHDLLETHQPLTVVDLRVPLDLLAHSEIIPGSQRIAPSEILANPSLLPKEGDYVLYCTCPDDHSSETVLEAALKMGFMRVRVLTGGIGAWKQMGYPVEPYTQPFHLDIQ